VVDPRAAKLHWSLERVHSGSAEGYWELKQQIIPFIYSGNGLNICDENLPSSWVRNVRTMLNGPVPTLVLAAIMQ